MIMGIRRDLAAFVLLAHLVTLSRGNVDEKRALEEILAKNVTIVIIENKGDEGPMNLEKLRNSTSLVSGYENSTSLASGHENSTSLVSGHGNSTVPSNATDVVDENEVVAELEEALVAAASSGQVIMIAPPADRGKSSNSLPGPVIVIETPFNGSKSLVNEVVSGKSKKRKAAGPSLDQEIAQSQTRERSDREDHADEEDLETLGDLLAITEYEPQRIDAKTVDEIIPRVTSDQSNSTLQLTINPRPEETHYDVPRQKNPPRSYQRSSDNLRPASVTKSSNNSSFPDPLKATTSYSPPTPADRKSTTSVPQDHKVERRKPATPSAFDVKPNSPEYTEIIRGPRNTEIIVPLTTRPTSAPRKLTYNEITRKNGLIGAQSTVDTTSTSFPDLSSRIETRRRNIHNFTGTSDPPLRILHSSRVPTTPVSFLPSTHYPFLQQRTSSFASAKPSSSPTLQSSAVPRASRRIDDYYTTRDYATSTNESPQPLLNKPLGYLTRYNQPSLVTRQFPSPRLYPTASDFRQSSKDSPGEKRSDENSQETTSPRSSRTIPVHDDHENTRLRFGVSRTTSRPPFVDYQKIYQRENLRHQPRDEKVYEKNDQINHRDNQSLRPTQNYGNVHGRHDERPQTANNYQNTLQRTTPPQKPNVDHWKAGTSSKKTAASIESYEDDEQEHDKSEAVRSPEATGRVTNNVNPRSRNSLNAFATTPAEDSYEDEEPENPKPHQPRFTTVGNQRQRLTTTPYVVPTRPVYRSSDHFSGTPQPVTPTSLLDNPIYQLHGVKTSPGSVAANAIRGPSKDHRERRLPTASAPIDTRFQPRGTSAGHRIVATTSASDSDDDSSQEDDERPATIQRLRSRNHVDRHVEKPAHSVYNDDLNAATVATQPKKQRALYPHDVPISERFSHHQTKSLSQPAFNRERNANSAGGAVTTPAYGDYGGVNEEDSNDERRYPRVPTKLRALNDRPVGSESPASQSTRATDYESYEEDEDEEDKEDEEVSPSGSEKLIESHTANYGNRVRPRVVDEEERRRYVPSYFQAATTSRGGNVRTNHGGRRRDSGYAEDEEEEEKPVESVQRADVEEAAYEDEVPAGSGHTEDQASHQTHAKAKKHGGGGGGGGESKHEEGGGLKHEQDHHEAHGEKGDKGYKGYHEYDKGKKGHHDKEDHDKEYDEKKGEKKKHEEEGGYHKEHHHGEKGDKEAEFAEKGEHQKGHSTKGQHVVHKKDEYEKKTEFYDESHEEDGDAKEGEYHHEHEHKKGGHEKKGHHDSAHHEDKYGEKGEHEKGHHYHEKKGHDGKDGKDQHHEHHEKYGKKGGHEEGLKWSHKKGDDGHGGGKKKGS